MTYEQEEKEGEGGEKRGEGAGERTKGKKKRGIGWVINFFFTDVGEKKLFQSVV